MVMSNDETIRYIEHRVAGKCIGLRDDPEDAARIVLRFQRGENTTNINLERRRLRQIARSDARSIIARIQESLHRFDSLES